MQMIDHDDSVLSGQIHFVNSLCFLFTHTTIHTSAETLSEVMTESMDESTNGAAPLVQHRPPGIRVCVDRGGTFTDCIAFVPHTIHPTLAAGQEPPPPGFREIVVKLLSVDPANYDDAPREGIRRILELATGIPHPQDVPVDTQHLELIRMGTTVATNALLERKGERTALLITTGFKDLLHIGNQSRPNIFDLSITAPDVLHERVVEIDERVTLFGYSAVESGMCVSVPPNDPLYVQGVTGEWVRILKKPDIPKITADLQAILDEGITSVAICLMHSFTYPDHEKQLGELCQTLGFKNITLSSATMPMIKIVPRGTSASADSYLTPGIKTYTAGFFSGFDNGIVPSSDGSKASVRVEFMQSDGGLVHVNDFNGFRAILSGPAGGVVGYAMTSWDDTESKAVIGFDMGGTSTDVSRYAGRYEHVYESTTAGITIQAPQLDINTVAAGGGSQLFFRNGMFVVGPESAGANPGPTCYRKSGPLTITDANLVLGRLVPDFFPKIFGKSAKEPLDKTAAEKAFDKLTKDINGFLKTKFTKDSGDTESFTPMTRDEIAYGFIKVANESMCRPIRALTEGKGYNASNHLLACFGGAGGQHAFAIAKSLGIKTVLIHRHSSILSAYGLSLADVVHEMQEPSAIDLSEKNLDYIKTRASALIASCTKALEKQGFEKSHIQMQVLVNLRYQGTDNAIMTPKPTSSDDWDFMSGFVSQYKHEFGFTLPDRAIQVDDIRVRGIGKSRATSEPSEHTHVHRELKLLKRRPVSTENSTTVSSYWSGLGRIDVPVFQLKQLEKGDEITGPALIIDATATIAIEPNCKAVVTSEHVVGFVGEDTPSNSNPESSLLDTNIPTVADPILLSVFGHRFMSIAEQMGRTLQKTSISTNIKERLDFSCALFGHDGGLVANAPHIPVHLGSMQEAVRWQMNHLKGNLKDGDVILANHPTAGGSHLPDITVITPVFEKGEVVLFVASREGAAVKSFKLVRDGKFDEAGITKILLDDPAQYEGCSGTRCLRDNISDLKAQVAANHKGITLTSSLIKEYGIQTVQAYMGFIRENADLAVRNLLRSVAKQHGTVLEAVEYMDNGSPICLKVTIDPKEGVATFDFGGTGAEVYGNINAPRSVSFSAIIYCLRCLINVDMPLNQGALAPITVVIPDGCLLNPSEGAAVVGGNVLTSQRLCDVIFKAFQACAASQGCCNNFTFGMGGKSENGKVVDGFGYYETIAGGSGAGPTWNGRGGVHTHMTNTRITDPEIMERRYPVILRQFGLRSGSGGNGLHHGGEGVVREIEFLETLHVSMLSERRVFCPYGMNGGEDGKKGMNSLFRAGKTLENGDREYRELNFGGKNTTIVKPGDRLRIATPGGGGWGSVVESTEVLAGSLRSKRKRSVTTQNEIKNPEKHRATPRKSGGGSLQNYTDMQFSA
ncbi:hypothetical protein BASA62_007754 [Batrachochytrium salamandrivorans]|nr:hypothetical protein BASA62_007754 [Batrachochytrium salamandrivorans]